MKINNKLLHDITDCGVLHDYELIALKLTAALGEQKAVILTSQRRLKYKSLACINIACTLRKMGKTVLIVDCTDDNVTGAQYTHKLNECLNSEVKPCECIITFQDVDICTPGAMSFLEYRENAITNVIGSLSQKYDLTLIITESLAESATTYLLKNVTPNVVLLSSCRDSVKSNIAAIKMLEFQHMKIVGHVIFK